MASQVEQSAAVSNHVRALLEQIREHVDDEVVENTPARVAKAWAEMTSGYKTCPRSILEKRFPSKCDEMVVVSGIHYQSLCAHHLLPFEGIAAVAYVPKGAVVGLSKLPRLVHCFARRLQIQEELTSQIADAIVAELDPKGVGVIMSGSHSCMRLRGVRCSGRMTTSALRGVMAESQSARSEFIQLAKMGG